MIGGVKMNNNLEIIKKMFEKYDNNLMYIIFKNRRDEYGELYSSVYSFELEESNACINCDVRNLECVYNTFLSIDELTLIILSNLFSIISDPKKVDILRLKELIRRIKEEE